MLIHMSVHHSDLMGEIMVMTVTWKQYSTCICLMPRPSLVPRLAQEPGNEASPDPKQDLGMSLVEYKNSHTCTIYVSLVPMLFECMYQEAGEEPGKRGLGFCILGFDTSLPLRC